MKVLVTGGSGFIGSNLVAKLVESGHEVLSLDPLPPRNLANQGCTIKLDPLDEDGLRSIATEFAPDYVYHLGARTDLLGEGLDDYSSNTRGVEIVIRVLKELKSVRAVFFASSRLVCEIGYQPKDEFDYCPTTPYGESKVQGEKLVRASGLEIPWCIFRPTSIWGPWFDIPYKTFFLSVASGKYVHPRGEKIHKSFGFVGNSVFQLIKLMDMEPAVYAGKTFYLCDDTPLEVGEWADEIADEIGRKRPMRVSLGLLGLMAKAGDMLKILGMKNPPLTSFRLANLTTQMELDSSFLKQNATPLPYSRKEGVKQTVRWLKESGQI